MSRTMPAPQEEKRHPGIENIERARRRSHFERCVKVLSMPVALDPEQHRALMLVLADKPICAK